MDFTKGGRILYVTMADVTQPNGPGVNEREFLLSLYRRLGDRMHALVPQPRRACREIDPARTTFYRNPRRWNPAGYLLQQWELQRRVGELLATGEFDLLVARLSLGPLALRRLRSGRTPYAVKTLGDVQGLARNTGVKGLVSKIVGPVNERLFRDIVAGAIAVDACTPELVTLNAARYGLTSDRLLLVENATCAERFSPEACVTAKRRQGLLRFDSVLGYVGGVPYERGGLQMLEIANRLRHDHPTLGVLIVGDDRGDRLKQRAQELGLADRTVLTGVVPYEKVPEYVKCFDIGFALDDPARTRVSGNSYQKVRQYLACGKAVVTFMGSDSDLVREGLVENVAADDPGGLERAVRQLLARTAAEEIRHAARASRFIRERLSTQLTLEQRLQFWGRRLAVQKGRTTAAPPPLAKAG